MAPAILISADDIKKEIEGYTPEKAEDFHEHSARLADKRFDKALKLSDFNTVILMSGGPASGKTEFISEYLLDQNVIIYDGILPTEKGAKIKIEHIQKAKKELNIYAVWPEDLRQAYVAFLHRDRKFSDEHFFTKHADARQTLLWIAQNYPEIGIKVYKSDYIKDDLYFTEIRFDTRGDLVVYLSDNQYNSEQIIKLVTK